MLGWLRRREATIYPADEVGDALYEAFPDARKLPARAPATSGCTRAAPRPHWY